MIVFIYIALANLVIVFTFLFAAGKSLIEPGFTIAGYYNDRPLLSLYVFGSFVMDLLVFIFYSVGLIY